ncbi:MAG: terpene cyclase/mutase family protein [Actinomycetota bacterium]|nr:terpene cyclase/mutase family protein [Actinomycetota bacterium]
MGLKALAAVLASLLALPATSARPIERATAYVAARQQADGGFAEAGQPSTAVVTAWAALGLVAAGRVPERAADYLTGKPYPTATDLALRVLALAALGRDVAVLAGRLDALRRTDGRVGALVNSTAWGVLALRAAGRPAGARSVRFLLRRQRPDGGWPWFPGGASDSNDTAAVIQALRAAGVPKRNRAIRRGVAYLRKLQNRDGGFALAAGRASDAQSTAWAIQAFVAAGRAPGGAPFAFLNRLQRSDGSFRYSRRYATTPVWVTSQVLPALARRPFPLAPR